MLPELDVEWFLINIFLINNYKLIRSSKILANQIFKKIRFHDKWDLDMQAWLNEVNLLHHQTMKETACNYQ